ncbi:MAG: bifunctional diguanylate cyclase/phosphodiesterase [Epsilonproteobacteria bacterium]|nr:bifunctional diguanylate cyclase/phosphodiesterase [Campylobacterota bacterium]
MAILLCVLISLIAIATIFIIKKRSKEELSKVVEELSFFKKEREYNEEAMIMFNGKYQILYANLAAKKLFDLSYDENKHIYNANKSVKVETQTQEEGDFFNFIKQKIDTDDNNVFLNNIELVDSENKMKVSILLDKNGLKLNNTLTCIIDTKPKDISIESDSNSSGSGKIDFLTGLPSQFTSLSDINTLVIDSKRKSESFALMLLGIDHFNEIQLALGHTHINQILKKMANFFIENPDEHRKVYRMDCDKFLVSIKYVDSNELAHEIARDLLIDIQNYFKGDSNIRLSVSAGIVIYPNHGQNAAKLINNVYLALDEAHKEGESSIVVSDESKLLIHQDEQRLNEEIKKAIRKSEFLLHYQPTFDIQGEEMVGAEALLRWKHPEHGLITPDKFLDVAQKTGLIVDIGEYVFNEAIEQRKEWDKKGYKKLRITINLSLKEMQVDELIEKLEKLFQRHNVDPSEFNIDISEKDAMINIKKTIEDCHKFRKLGLSVSLDQFGSSFTSLKYLQQLPLWAIKIDRTLIFDISTNSDHRTSVEAIIKMAQVMKFDVVAEGVETSKELTILNEMGCNYAQGYLFSRPMNVLDFQELLKEEEE